MHLVKWFRKNNTKIMAVVVIVIMLGFIGGSYITQFAQRRRMGMHKVIARFADGRKITSYDRALAQQELEILRMLQADVLLRSINVPIFRAPDLRAVLLGELLFSERGSSPELVSYMKQIIRANGYRISSKQIDDIYKHSVPNDIYWLLLRNEARIAGFYVSKDTAGNLLGEIIPQIFKGTTYQQVIGSIIKRQGIPEDDVLATFGKLMAILEYSRVACLSEDITTRQLRQAVSLGNETVDVELVRFDAAVFADTQPEPTQQEISEQFDKYKAFFAGTISDQNPYGFGYKLPDRVQLEYIMVKLDDVTGIVTPPDYQQTEIYYRKNREQYVEKIPSDPNDPNSPLIERTKSYAEVMDTISKTLLQSRINSRASEILREAKALTDTGLQDANTQLSLEQLEQMAGDYQSAVRQLSERYKINIYTGKTGLLGAADIRQDERIGTLYLKGYGRDPVGLAQVVFAVDELKASELGLFDVPKPRMYENIGPLADVFGKTMAIVRVIRAEKAVEPQSAEQSYSRETVRFDNAAERPAEKIYSVKEKVTDDLKKLAAMDTVRSEAKEFIKQVAEDGWEGAIEKFNHRYKKEDVQEGQDPNAFELQSLTNVQRVPEDVLAALAVQSQGNPTAQFLGDERAKHRFFVDKLYSLVPQDSDTVMSTPLVMEFKPDASFYVIKSISVRHINEDEYEKSKAMQAYKMSFIQSQSLAAVYFNPENILKRMNFKPLED